MRTVYYNASLEIILTSCSRLDEHGVTSINAKGQCTWLDRDDDNKALVLSSRRVPEGKFVTCLEQNSTKGDVPGAKLVVSHSNSLETNQTASFWHRRTAHVKRRVAIHMTSKTKYAKSPNS